MEARIEARVPLAIGAALIALACACFGAGTAAGEQPLPEAFSPPVVATVSHVPGQFGTVTKKELGRGIAQVRAGSQGSPGHRPQAEITKVALEELLETAYLEGEAVRRGLVVTGREISIELGLIKKDNFKSKADYQHFLHQNKLTPKEVRERVRLQIIITEIEEAVLRGIRGEAARIRAFGEFIDAYKKRWRARTVCAPNYATALCSNSSPSA